MTGPFEQTFVPLSQGGSIGNLASIGPMVSEEKMFENVDIHTYIHTYIHTRTTQAYLCYKLTYEPKGSGELIQKANYAKIVCLNNACTRWYLRAIVYVIFNSLRRFYVASYSCVINDHLTKNPFT